MGVRISWLMLARNSLLARLAASAAIFARTKLCFGLLPFLFVFDGLQGERQVGRQLVEQAEFLVVEGCGTVRVNGKGAKQPALVDDRRSRHRTVASGQRRLSPRGKAGVGGRILAHVGLPFPQGRANGAASRIACRPK